MRLSVQLQSAEVDRPRDKRVIKGSRRPIMHLPTADVIRTTDQTGDTISVSQPKHTESADTYLLCACLLLDIALIGYLRTLQRTEILLLWLLFAAAAVSADVGNRMKI